MAKIVEGFRLIIQDLRTDGWRSAVTVLNLMVFISCYFCLASLAEAGHKFGSQPVDHSKLMMISHNVFDLSDSRITDQDFEAALELSPSLIKSVSPLILKHLNVEGYLLQVRGAPLDDFEAVHSLSLIEGRWPTGRNEIVIGEGTVALTKWQIGDELRIFGVKHLITGVTRSAGTKFASIWMSLDHAEELFNTKGVYQFAWIVLQKEVNAQDVIDQLQNDSRIAGRFDVYFADRMYELYSGALTDINEISSILVFLALICVMLGVYGSTYLTLNERRRELTILRSIGFGSQEIRMVLSMRTLLQVLVAFIIGLGVSLLAIKIYEHFHPIVVRSIPLPVVISLPTLLIGVFCTTFFAWLGVWIPTRHLRKTSVISMIQR